MFLYALTILVSAFLLFQVQPVIAKIILPWFGGSAAVWTTCMLFFQVVLLAGYAYAHGLGKLGARRQAIVHTVLLLAALATLPIMPAESWKPTGEQEPITRILLCGGSAMTPGLREYLQNRFNVPAEIANPLTRIGYDAALFDGREVMSVAPLLTVGIVLALIFAVLGRRPPV